jgi:hypothetical protein
MEEIIKIVALWVVALCNLVCGYHHFGKTCYEVVLISP